MPISLAALRRQSEVYVGGMAGQKPLVPVGARELEAAARRRMTAEAFAYVAGGAGGEATMRANLAAFERRRIVPRMLRDVGERDISVELFGRALPAPLLTAPVGVLELAHAEADLAVAQAAAEVGVPMVFSSQASVPMEACAKAMGDSPRWFQLYWSKNDAVVESFVRRAEACGCEAIVVTLDTTLLGWRTRDLELAYLPFLRGKGIAQYVSDPVFMESLRQPVAPAAPPPPRKVNLTSLAAFAALTRAHPGSFLKNLRSGVPLAAVQQFIATYSRPSLTWNDLPFLRARTRLPILLKGILHPDDARRALDCGMDGIIVSNHGGRQVDGSIATLDALPPIVAAVDGRVPVLMDSGIRGGADVFKAVALGARAVLVGRPYVYALALAGRAGVAELLRNLIADFELTMGLAGCASVGEIDSECLLAEG
jgi:lactate 2-monooxygenase